MPFVLIAVVVGIVGQYLVGAYTKWLLTLLLVLFWWALALYMAFHAYYLLWPFPYFRA